MANTLTATVNAVVPYLAPVGQTPLNPVPLAIAILQVNAISAYAAPPGGNGPGTVQVPINSSDELALYVPGSTVTLTAP